MDDPDNARSAYDQALALDTKDPAVPLNYAVLLYNQGDSKGAGTQMQQFEARVAKIRQTPGLDADPDVSASGEIMHDLKTYVNPGEIHSTY